MNKIIDSISDCTIIVFMKCLFENKLNALIISGDFTEDEQKEAWNSIYTEFLDLSGLIESAEFEILKSIFYLDCRVKRIKLLIHIQNESISKIGMPCIGAFEKIRVYGHKLIWDKLKPDLEAFKRQLISIEMKERKYELELNAKTKEFFEFKKKESMGEVPIVQKRKEFIRTLNNLQKAGYVIDKEKTTIEELALMLFDYNESLQKESLNGKK